MLTPAPGKLYAAYDPQNADAASSVVVFFSVATIRHDGLNYFKFETIRGMDTRFETRDEYYMAARLEQYDAEIMHM